MLRYGAILIIIIALYFVWKFLRFTFKYALILSIVLIAAFYSPDITNVLSGANSYIDSGSMGNEIHLAKSNSLVIESRFMLNTQLEVKFYSKSNSDELLIHDKQYVLVETENLVYPINEIELSPGSYVVEVYSNDKLIHENNFLAIN